MGTVLVTHESLPNILRRLMLHESARTVPIDSPPSPLTHVPIDSLPSPLLERIPSIFAGRIPDDPGIHTIVVDGFDLVLDFLNAVVSVLLKV